VVPPVWEVLPMSLDNVLPMSLEDSVTYVPERFIRGTHLLIWRRRIVIVRQASAHSGIYCVEHLLELGQV